MSADTLTASSRQFFERTKGKLAASIFAAAFGLVFLGFCAATGGQSQAAGDNAKDSSGDSKDAQNSLQSGFGKFDFILFQLKVCSSPGSVVFLRFCRILLYFGICYHDCWCYLYFSFVLWIKQ